MAACAFGIWFLINLAIGTISATFDRALGLPPSPYGAIDANTLISLIAMLTCDIGAFWFIARKHPSLYRPAGYGLVTFLSLVGAVYSYFRAPSFGFWEVVGLFASAVGHIALWWGTGKALGVWRYSATAEVSEKA